MQGTVRTTGKIWQLLRLIQWRLHMLFKKIPSKILSIHRDISGLPKTFFAKKNTMLGTRVLSLAAVGRLSYVTISTES